MSLLTLARRAAVLPATGRRRATKLVRLLGWRQAIVFALQWLRGSRCVALRLPGMDAPVWCRTRNSDIAVLYSAFCLRDCDEPLAVPPETILDLGANIGFVSLFFARKYPRARIVAVEVDPANVELLRKNTQDYRVEIVEGAVWDAPRPYLIDQGDGRSYQFKIVEVPAGTPGASVAWTVPALLERCQIRTVDLLKMDIEGAEEAIFQGGVGEWIDRVGMLIVEPHGAAAQEAILSAMACHGFVTHTRDEKWVFQKA